jgi:hypothetical protein
MPLEITCTSCRHRWFVPDAAVGAAVACPKCRQRLVPSTPEAMENYATKVLFGAPAVEEVVHHPKPKGPEVIFVCPFCDATYRVSKKLAGKKINCRNCHEPSRV